MKILLGVLALNAYLYVVIPKGFFPQQDTGRLIGRIQADQSTSFQLMRTKLTQFANIVQEDPAIDTVVGFTGGSQTNTGSVFVALKARSERASIDQVMAMMTRGRFRHLPVVRHGALLGLVSIGDVVKARLEEARHETEALKAYIVAG